LSNREIRFFSIVGLIFGVLMLYLGLSGSSSCAAQVLGQTTQVTVYPCGNPNTFQIEVFIGLLIIIVTLVGLGVSFSKPTTAGS
jgi:hypothetical protein